MSKASSVVARQSRRSSTVSDRAIARTHYSDSWALYSYPSSLLRSQAPHNTRSNGS